MAKASTTPSEIGTSMLSRRARKALKALSKKGWPAKAAAGNAINAERPWNISRVAGSMSVSSPIHTAADSSIFIAAKAAMARQRSSRFEASSSARSPLASSNG